MVVRPTLKRPQNDEDVAAKGQTRSTEARFFLRVDSQVKRSFDDKEAAGTAARAIKKAFPVVVVSVVDTEDGTTEIVTA
jgi:hypothetical protein